MQQQEVEKEEEDGDEEDKMDENDRIFDEVLQQKRKAVVDKDFKSSSEEYMQNSEFMQGRNKY
jgi:hypothetical protein